MSDSDVPPDGIVRTALQLLPVPPHGDGFWVELDDRLDVESGVVRSAAAPVAVAPAASPAPADPVTAVLAPVPAGVAAAEHGSLALVPPALRRGSNAVLLAMAAAAAVVVLVAGGTLVNGRDATRTVDPADERAAEEIDALLDGQVLEGTLASMSADVVEASSDAVLAFVEALHEGDAGAAWSALGPASRAVLGSQASFAGELAALDLGAWAATEPEQVLVTPLTSEGDDLIAIVTLVGQVEVDGVLEARADAFPIRVTDGEVLLEAFAPGAPMELVVPEGVADLADRPIVEGDDEMIIVLPAGASAPILRLDDGPAVICGAAPGTELSGLDGMDGQRCAYRPDEGIATGDHTLTVAYLSSDGLEITAESVLFAAA